MPGDPGWEICGSGSVPSLVEQDVRTRGRECHQHDAYTIAAWLRRADTDGSLASFLNPHLEEQERKTAEIERLLRHFRLACDSGTACGITVAQSDSVDRKIMSRSSCQFS
jgi:hypothetical protein